MRSEGFRSVDSTITTRCFCPPDSFFIQDRSRTPSLEPTSASRLDNSARVAS